MQRRKFVVGLGSLAAGASAVMGTGAISSSSFSRDVTGQVVNDKNGYVQVLPDGTGAPIEYHGGEVVIDFDDLGSSSQDPEGKGLNSDSINYFDNLLELRVMHEDTGSSYNGNNTPYYGWFTSPHSRLKFYPTSNQSGTAMGASNAAKMVKKDDEGGNVGSNEKVAYWRKIFGLCVDLEDSGLSPGDSVDQLFGGKENFRIHVQQGSP